MKKYRFLSGLLSLVLLLSVFTLPALALEDPDPRCGAAIVVDADYGEVVYEKNAYDRMYPASITKIMTSLLVLEAVERGELSLDMEVTASETAIAALTSGASTQNIKPGEVLTLEQLLYCDLVASANEACNIMAELVGGTMEGFAVLMNERAAELGMENTHFVNPNGLHDPDHYSTAYDIYLMAKEAMSHELFRTIVSTAKYVVPATNMSGARTLRTTNALIDNWRISGYVYPYAIGIKTGFTTPAGQCLASAAVDKEGRTYYCVILGAENITEEDGSITRYAFKESRRLLEWGFANFQRTTLMDQDLLLREVAVTLSETEHVLVHPVGLVERTMPKDYDPDLAELIVDLPESVEAPVAAGQHMGTVTLVYDGEELGTLPLVAADSVERSETLYYIQQVQYYLSLWWVKAAIIAFVVLVLFLILWLGVILPRRRRRRRYSYSGRRRY